MSTPELPRRSAAHPRTALAAMLVLLAGTVQCSGGPTEPKVVPVGTVQVSPANAALLVGQASQLSAATLDAAGNALAGRTVTWSSSDAGKASVSSSGLVSAVAPGSATITATSEGRSGTATVTVSPVPVASVAVSATTLQLLVGQTQQLTAAGKDSVGGALTGRTFTWASSDSTKAKVSATGLVTAVGAGVATITVSSEGRSASVAVTVIGAPAGVAFASQLLFVAPNASASTTVSVVDVNNRVVPGATLTYTSRTPSVASVSASGTVNGVAAGQAVIVATVSGSATPVADSLLVVVADAATPVLATSLGAMTLKSDTTLTVSVVANWGTGAPKLASGVLVVTWSANALTLTATNTGAQTVPAVNNASASTGTLQLAFADANGFTGSAEVARLTFHVTAPVGTAGTLTVTTRELGASDFTDLTAAAVSVLHRFVIR
ncbi:MAG: Ig domain-containing protein [Gemmatimonadetes bacterium]|nr:Ig domain-containing protein [Gemmatimonadota bacterium]